MIYCIFRKSDKEILYMTDRAEQLVNEKETCLRNEGGTENDYIIVESDGPIPNGMVPSLTPDNQVEFIPNPKIVAKNAARAKLATKLRALGITDQEIELLGVQNLLQDGQRSGA